MMLFSPMVTPGSTMTPAPSHIPADDDGAGNGDPPLAGRRAVVGGNQLYLRPDKHIITDGNAAAVHKKAAGIDKYLMPKAQFRPKPD